MKELKGNLKTLYILLIIWLLSILFSAVMFTMALIYDVLVTVIVSGITGVLALIGVFYTAYMIMRIRDRLYNIDK